MILPLFFSKPENNRQINISLPSVYNGDEPHYLLMMSSLINDKDLDLKNNYLAVHQGAVQAGKRFAGTPVAHHIYWYVNGKYYEWWKECSKTWRLNSSGVLLPQIKDTVLANITAKLPEYGIHPPGLAFIMVPVLYPFKNTKFFEPMAIIYNGLFMVIAMLFFQYLLCAYTDNARVRIILTAVIFFGSPVWFYARTLYSEGTMTLLAVAAYAFYISGKKIVLPGLLIGFGILFKPVFGILAAPLVLDMVLDKKIHNSMRFCATVSLGIFVLLLINYRMNGSIFKAMHPFIFGNTLSGTLELLTDKTHGILLFCPVFIIAVFFWPSFILKFRRKAWIPGLGFALYFIVMATFFDCSGGASYGPRLIIPVIPFILLPILLFFINAGRYGLFTKGIVTTIVLLSIFINANGAVCSWKFIDRNPLIASYVKIAKKF